LTSRQRDGETLEARVESNLATEPTLWTPVKDASQSVELILIGSRDTVRPVLADIAMAGSAATHAAAKSDDTRNVVRDRRLHERIAVRRGELMGISGRIDEDDVNRVTFESGENALYTIAPIGAGQNREIYVL